MIMEDFVPYKEWLHQHDEKIRREYQERPTETLAGEMDVGYYTVSRRAARMGVGKSAAFMRSSWKKAGGRKARKSTEEGKAKDAYLKEHFADTPNEELACRFGVDVKTVRRWARRLCLAKSEAFMQAARSRGSKNRYYTGEQKVWRNRRIAEVYPDGDDDALQRLAGELGVTLQTLRLLARDIGIHRSKERVREAKSRAAARHTKYTTEVITALKEYYPDHTRKECSERFDIPEGVITQLAVKHKMRKSREYIHKVRSMKKPK